MPLANTPDRYGTIAKCFHWVTVLLILILFPLGKTADGWPYGRNAELQTKFLLFSLHKTFGVILFGLALLRIFWTLPQPSER